MHWQGAGDRVVFFITMSSKKNLSREELLQRIWIDPARCFGKPCIRGHRIWVSLILDMLASGSTEQEILEVYPNLEPEDIQACIAYGAEMSRERYVDVPLEGLSHEAQAR
jgi:uncharacterized protein (DUF433 family)